jgi:hypothetical protein
MKKVLESLAKYPYLFVLFVSLIYAVYNWKTLDHRHLMYGDMVGRWVQVQDILQKPLGDYSCNYNEPELDPDHRFIPLPEHFFFYKGKQCIHAYPYPYAFLVAPFVQLAGAHGFYLFNGLFWLLYIFTAMKIISKMIPNNNYLQIFTGLSMFYILPTAIYLYDFSELILSMSIANLALLWFIDAFSFEDDTVKKKSLLFFSGFISGIAFVLRPENVIFYCGILLGAFVIFIIRNRESSFYKRFVYPVVKLLPPAYIGLIVGFLLTVLYHYLSFETLLPSRIAAPKSIPEQNLYNKLSTILTLFVGGNKGLFSSLPFTLLSFSIFIPTVYRNTKYKGLFLFIISMIPSLIVIAITPGDGGYSWSPRYLALMIAPFLYLAILVCYTLYANLGLKKVAVILSIGLISYSVVFASMGVKILRSSTKQGTKYDAIITKFNDSKLILLQANKNRETMYVFLSEASYKNSRIFAVFNHEDFDELLSRLEKEGVNSFIFASADMLGPRFAIPKGWKIKNSESFFKVTFDQVVKE